MCKKKIGCNCGNLGSCYSRWYHPTIRAHNLSTFLLDSSVHTLALCQNCIRSALTNNLQFLFLIKDCSRNFCKELLGAPLVVPHLPPPPALFRLQRPCMSFRSWLKGDGREVGFEDGGCFSRFLKRERINNQTFIAFLNCG